MTVLGGRVYPPRRAESKKDKNTTSTTRRRARRAGIEAKRRRLPPTDEHLDHPNSGQWTSCSAEQLRGSEAKLTQPRTHISIVNSPAGRFSEGAIGSRELSRLGVGWKEEERREKLLPPAILLTLVFLLSLRGRDKSSIRLSLFFSRGFSSYIWMC